MNASTAPIKPGAPGQLPVILPAGLEARRGYYEGALAAARLRLRSFAATHGWTACVAEPFADALEVYDDKAALNARLRGLVEIPEGFEIPSTFCAALERRRLVTVDAELYARLYPEGDEPGAYEKLLTHELAHRLHIALLDGDEEAMGPVWFYEGFAIHAAGQFVVKPRLDRAELIDLVESPERGGYRAYSRLIEVVLETFDLAELVEEAGNDGFNAAVLKRCFDQ
jgi:hypothetical protein